MFDFSHPAFRPLSVRIGVVAVALGWAVVEIVTGAPFWAILFGAAGAYCAYQLLIVFPRPDPDDRQDP